MIPQHQTLLPNPYLIALFIIITHKKNTRCNSCTSLVSSLAPLSRLYWSPGSREEKTPTWKLLPKSSLGLFFALVVFTCLKETDRMQAGSITAVKYSNFSSNLIDVAYMFTPSFWKAVALHRSRKNSPHQGIIDLVVDQYALNVGASICFPCLISVIAPLTNG